MGTAYILTDTVSTMTKIITIALLIVCILMLVHLIQEGNRAEIFYCWPEESEYHAYELFCKEAVSK